MRKTLFLFMLMLAAICSSSCQKEPKTASGKLQVVTTLFPLYDFARQIGGEKAEVRLLLPPGVEPHSFEPRPDDIIRVSRADLFIFTNKYMEPWAAKIIGSVPDKKVQVVDASLGVELYRAGQEHAEGEKVEQHSEAGVDPHIWLDFANDLIIVDNILAAFIAKDPANRDYYTANAAAYKQELICLG